MVLGHAVEVPVERVEAGRGEHADLAHPAAHPFALDACLRDLLRRTQHQRADRGAETLRQADRHRVGDCAVRLQRRPGRDVGVPDARAVHVHAAAELVGRARAAPGGRPAAAPCRLRSCACSRRRWPSCARRTGPCPARASIGSRRGRSALLVDPGPAGQAGERYRARRARPGGCVPSTRRAPPVRPDERRQRQHVGHRPGRGEQRVLEAEHRSDPHLQLGDRRVLSVDVIADLRVRHRLTHPLGRPGDGVGAQVDRAGDGLREGHGPSLGRDHCSSSGVLHSSPRTWWSTKASTVSYQTFACWGVSTQWFSSGK